MNKIPPIFLLNMALSLITGCSATTKDLERELSRELTPGVSTLADTLMAFGVPDQVYEDGRIIAYPGLIQGGLPSTLLRAPHYCNHDSLSGYPLVATEVFMTFDKGWVLTGWKFVNKPGME